MVTEPEVAGLVPTSVGVVAITLTRLAPAAAPPNVPVAPALRMSDPWLVALCAVRVPSVMRVWKLAFWVRFQRV